MSRADSREAAVRSRERFCEYLRSHRRAADKSLEEIALVTKIPERSLRCLEDGKFEQLPADVFVRGFLRSYATCLGLDVDDVLRRYAACGLQPAPVASDLAVVPAGQADEARAAADAGEGVGAVRPAAPAGPPTGDGEVAAAATPRPEPRARRSERRSPGRATGSAKGHRRRPGRGRPGHAAAAERRKEARTFLPPQGLEDDAPRRGPLTLAVIILVIVATLAMSYLLRKPTEGGDGITRAPAAAPRLG
jgi:hypothetical protein